MGLFEQYPILMLPAYAAFRVLEEVSKWAVRSLFKRTLQHSR